MSVRSGALSGSAVRVFHEALHQTALVESKYPTNSCPKSTTREAPVSSLDNLPRSLSAMILRLLTLAFILLAAATATATNCLTPAVLGYRLASYTVRAIAHGIPRSAVVCVFRAVHAHRTSASAVGCLNDNTLGRVMGTALPGCVSRLRGGAQSLRTPHATRRKLSLSLAPASAGALAPRVRVLRRLSKVLKTPLRLPFLLRRARRSRRRPGTARVRGSAQKRCRSWCNCYCDSGCHYCCSYAGTGIYGKPGQRCFIAAGCARQNAICGRRRRRRRRR